MDYEARLSEKRNSRGETVPRSRTRTNIDIRDSFYEILGAPSNRWHKAEDHTRTPIIQCRLAAIRKWDQQLNTKNTQIAPISAAYDQQIAEIIRTVGAEFGAVGEGFGPADEEVNCMSQHYDADQGSLYLVGLIDGKVAGGCGLAPFADKDGVCELKKLFLLPESRGYGLGRALTQACLDYAIEWGYRECYLDTLANMTAALALYEKLGFRRLARPMEGTEHNGCDVWMLKSLKN